MVTKRRPYHPPVLSDWMPPLAGPPGYIMGATGPQGLFTGDDDDNEQLAKLIVANTLGQVAMAVPVFGNPASDMIAAAMGAGSGRRGELSSALDTPLQLASTALTRGGKAYRDGEMDREKLLMSALDIGSYLARIPVGPVARRTARGLEQWEEGEGTPFSVIKPR